MRIRLASFFALLLAAGPASSQPVQPPWIFGMHDPGAEGEIEAKGKRGWIVFTEEVGHAANDPNGKDYRPWSSKGHGVIVRLNNGYGGAGTLPFESEYGNFAQRVANFIQNSPGADIWIIGNETNLPREWPGHVQGDPNTGEAITPQRYVNCFSQVHNELQRRGLTNEILVPAPTGTWGPPYDGTLPGFPNRGVPGFLDYWVQVLNGLGSTRVGGLAIHAYTHGGNGSAPLDPNLVFSDQKMDPPYQSIYYHFRVYRNFMGAIPQGMRSHPVWITEANEFRELPGYNWDPHSNTIQWVQNAYAEINNWNAASANQKIRAVALFRWPDVWEGDRNYCVSCVGTAVEGFRQALNHDYRWGAARGNDANVSRSQSAVPGSIPADQAAEVVLRVENTGGTTWRAGEAYRLGATSANQFAFEAFPCGGYSVSPTNARVFLCNDVAPGSSYDFRFRIRPAASVTGSQALSVRTVRDGFEWFGNTETWSINVTGQPPGCAATVPTERWKGEYFANMNLGGAPSMVRDDGADFLEFDWQTGSPGISCGIGADNFSARWTRTVSLGAGTYRFTVTSDDGFRLYVDGQLVLDKWIVQAPTTYDVDVSLGAGNHSLRMDYFENGGLAVAKLSWQLISGGVQTSKLGVHVVIGPRNGYGDFLRKIGDANKALAAVHCVDDFGAALEAKQYSARTVTIGRLRGAEDLIDLQKNPEADAEEFYAAVRDRWRANPSIDYWEAQNEINSQYDWQKRFYLRLMDLAEADGFKLALFASSTGTPPRPQDDGGMAYENIKDTCLRAKQGGHILSLHEYGGVPTGSTLRGSEPYHALRYRILYDYLRQFDAVIPLVISECAQNAGYQYPGLQIFMDDFMWYDSELMKDDYVLGATIFTVGNWANANFQEALPALADYIARTGN